MSEYFALRRYLDKDEEILVFYIKTLIGNPRENN